MEKRKERVLIGSCGGLTGIYLARRLRLNSSIQLFGTDVSLDNAAKFFFDEVFPVPAATDSDFVESICGLISRNKIDYYLPTHSKEIRVVSEHTTEIARTGCRFLVSSRESFHDLDDKVNANRALSNIGIPVPRMYLGDVPSDAFPVFIKQRVGSGSKGAAIVTDFNQLSDFRSRMGHLAIFEYLNGPEYTVDCMFDSAGKLLAYNQRMRQKTLGGAVVVTSNANPIDPVPYLNSIAKKWLLRGCVNFQYILNDGLPKFIDVNLRYPSGGLPLSVASGVDVPEMTLRILRGDQIEVGEYSSDGLCRTMYRYFDEIFEVKQ